VKNKIIEIEEKRRERNELQGKDEVVLSIFLCGIF